MKKSIINKILEFKKNKINFSVITNLENTKSYLFESKQFYFPLLASCPQAASMSFPRLLLTRTFTLFLAR